MRLRVQLRAELRKEERKCNDAREEPGAMPGQINLRNGPQYPSPGTTAAALAPMSVAATSKAKPAPIFQISLAEWGPVVATLSSRRAA